MTKAVTRLAKQLERWPLDCEQREFLQHSIQQLSEEKALEVVGHLERAERTLIDCWNDIREKNAGLAAGVSSRRKQTIASGAKRGKPQATVTLKQLAAEIAANQEARRC
jgi:hypothetical protein